MLKHILIKLTKIKHKEKMLKAAREKQQITYKCITIRLSAALSAETLQARREWHDIFKVMKGKNLQPRLLYGCLSDSKKKNQKVYRQAKDKKIQHHQTSSTTNAKRTSLSRIHKRRKILTKNKPKTIKKMGIGTYISIITLNVNGFNAPTKRHRVAEWIQKQDLYICCLQETHFTLRDTYRLKGRGLKKLYHANGNQKKAGVAILISDKVDFKIKTMTRDYGESI